MIKKFKKMPEELLSNEYAMSLSPFNGMGGEYDIECEMGWSESFQREGYCVTFKTRGTDGIYTGSAFFAPHLLIKEK